MRGAHGRPVRDREAEREQEFLKRQHSMKASSAPAQAVNKEVTISAGTTVKELAEKLGIKANLVIKALVDRGLFATINQTLDIELLKDLSKYFGATTTETSFEEESMQEVEMAEAPADKEKRAPVVTVMGHVDHGKTSLLDAIRQSNVAGREAGGITQAIGAYHVTHKDRRIVFIDTPGHEAFTRMRARGAKITDVVILVVAADDGVMPQTLEAIDHAKAAGVPIMVAINKIDVPNAQPDRVKQQLADRGLLPEDWGGDTVMVPVSAKTKENMELLLEMVLLVSDLNELTANPARPAVGTVIEAKLDRGQGPVATVLVQNGTLRLGDYFLVGSVFGKVRAMIDDRGEKITEAPPSTGVVVLGLEGLPQPGDLLQVVSDTDKAKKIGEFREEKAREQSLSKTSRLSLEQFQEQLKAGDVKELPIVLKADVQGSTEVLTDTLGRLSNAKVKVIIVRSGAGAISESDVLLAATANAIIIGFNVRPERSASVLADREKVDIRLYTVIYELVDEIRKAMAGLLEPIVKETFQGRAEVLDTFRVSKVGSIAGCVIQEGRVTRTSEVRLLRDNVVVYTGKVSSLRRFKDEASEVRTGQECGIGLDNFNDVKKGDVIEAFSSEKVAQEILA
jgi:translation initiation factor IF-2